LNVLAMPAPKNGDEELEQSAFLLCNAQLLRNFISDVWDVACRSGCSVIFWEQKHFTCTANRTAFYAPQWKPLPVCACALFLQLYPSFGVFSWASSSAQKLLTSSCSLASLYLLPRCGNLGAFQVQVDVRTHVLFISVHLLVACC